MRRTKQFMRPLLIALVMLMGMLAPRGAWAEELRLSAKTTIIDSDASYDAVYVTEAGILIINEGVTLTVTNVLAINYSDTGNGTVINYGTIKGDGYFDMRGGVLANHGHIDLSSASGDGTVYNTGTLGYKFNLYIETSATFDNEECDHANCVNLGTVEATCTHGAGTQFKCNTCYYIGINETGAPLPHDFHAHNSIEDICSSCGLTTYIAPANGDGSAESPYQIATASNLYWFADKVNNDYDNFKDANAILTADIIVNDGTFADDGTFTPTGGSEPSKPFEWRAIGDGSYENSYDGTFDGNGHCISGLYIDDWEEMNYAFIRTLGSTAEVKNLGIVNCFFNAEASAICDMNLGTISHCYSTGVISASFNSNGGLCDCNRGTIINCYSTCSVSAPFCAGGICIENHGNIVNCYFTGSLSSEYKMGGICVYNTNWQDEIAFIANCYTTCATAIAEEDEDATSLEVYADIPAESFASGEIAYKLNAGITDGTQTWYQKLGDGGDSYPVLAAAEGSTVYGQKTFDCGGSVVAYNYFNTKEEDVNLDHIFSLGTCTECGYECEHTSLSLGATPGYHGLYHYVCDVCKAESNDCVVKDGEAFQNPSQFSANDIIMARTFTQSVGDAVVPATIVLPFSIEAGKLATEEGGVVRGTKFYAFSSLEKNAETGKWEATMDRVKDVVEAYTPYMIVLTEGTTIDLGSNEVTFPATPATFNNTQQGDWTFVATNEEKVWTDADFANGEVYYGYAAGNETTPEGKFVKVGARASIAPLRAYIMKTPLTRAAGTLPSIISVRLNESAATGIGTLNTETGEFTFEGWYDLQGRRIGETVKDGIIINNNKKVIVK